MYLPPPPCLSNGKTPKISNSFRVFRDFLYLGKSVPKQQFLMDFGVLLRNIRKNTKENYKKITLQVFLCVFLMFLSNSWSFFVPRQVRILVFLSNSFSIFCTSGVLLRQGGGRYSERAENCSEKVQFIMQFNDRAEHCSVECSSLCSLMTAQRIAV